MSTSDWIGKTIGGRYQIEDLLGQGGMSSVYKATDPNLKRVVAIKMIHPHLSQEANFIQRFKEEATAVAQLRHPHIIQVYDFDQDGETFYMVLEFVPGETLEDRLQRANQQGRQLALETVVQHAVEICQAVDYAHERGMVHRDLKPANIMLNVQGEAILMDFGIAKIIGGQHHTATGAVLGTARYMSPEQIKGIEIDRRTDIYSLGVMLFEMVSGQPPFKADSAMTLMMMHVNDPIPDLRQLNPDLPPALVRIIEKALAKDRNQRFQTAGEMGVALRKFTSPAATPAVAVQPAPDPTLIAHPSTIMPSSVAEPIEAVPQVQQTGQPIAESPVFTIGQSPLGRMPGYNGNALPAASGQEQPASSRLKTISRPAIAAGAAGILALVLLIIAGAVYLPRWLSKDAAAEAAAKAPVAQAASIDAGDEIAIETAATTQAAGMAAPENTPTHTPEPTPLPTNTRQPTLTNTPAPSPTPTLPTDLYVSITGIESDGSYYTVSYETYGFQETLPGTHIHFFFDTVPVEQAGMPGSGPWKLYGGPRPFTQYRLVDRPANATQLCARVANPDHSLYHLESGNCFDLPQ